MRRLMWMAGMAACLVLAAIVVPVFAQTGFPTRTDTYINDFNQLLSSDSQAKIRGWLVKLQSQYNIEMTVVTINSIGDYKTSDNGTTDTSIESFSTHLFNHWGIGDALTNKGVMLVVSKGDRKVHSKI